MIVSDVVWRARPQGPLGEEWGWVAEMRPISAEEYSVAIEAAGLNVERTYVHERSAWEEYFGPMLAVANEAKVAQPADIFFADEIESAVALERRAVDFYIDYASFIATKPVP